MSKANRPKYSAAYSHFKSILGDRSLSHVADTLGGNVKINIELPASEGGLENACAIRLRSD